MAARLSLSEHHADINPIAFGRQSFAAVYLRTGQLTVSLTLTDADCIALADALTEAARQVRRMKATGEDMALHTALAADEREAA